MGNKLLRFTSYFSHVCLSLLMTIGVIGSGVKCLAVTSVLVDCMTSNSSSFWYRPKVTTSVRHLHLVA
jgi:hypothetical protein